MGKAWFKMSKLKRYLRLYRVLIAQFLKTIMQSKVDFLMGLFGFFFNQILGIAFLYLVFEQIPSLKGWTLDQLIFIYGFAQIPRGIDHLFTDNCGKAAAGCSWGTFDWHDPCVQGFGKRDCHCRCTAFCAVFCVGFGRSVNLYFYKTILCFICILA